MGYYDMMSFSDSEVTPGKKNKFRYIKGRREISIGDDTEITVPTNFGYF